MPNRDGTGPSFSYRFSGMGRGPCGQGRGRFQSRFRRGWIESVEPTPQEAPVPPQMWPQSPWQAIDERLARIEQVVHDLSVKVSSSTSAPAKKSEEDAK